MNSWWRARSRKTDAQEADIRNLLAQLPGPLSGVPFGFVLSNICCSSPNLLGTLPHTAAGRLLAAFADGGSSTKESAVEEDDVDGMPSVEIIMEKDTADIKPGDNMNVQFKIQPPSGQRVPSDICCVLDISGSMGAEAIIQAACGREERNGLTMLDIAKHGVRTVIATMNAHDRLSIVWFNHSAEILLPLTAMDGLGKEEANRKLDTLSEQGGTDIWKGLEKSLESLRFATGDGTKRLSHMMLLTDGQTKSRDSVIPNLKAYADKWENLPCTISTFGFGYNIDSELLCEIAEKGEATYSFIPDAGFVGTVFVNTMSNLLVTMARQAYLVVDFEDGAAMKKVRGVGGGMVSNRISLGTLQIEQSKDVVIEAAFTSDTFSIAASVVFEQRGGKKCETANVWQSGADNGPKIVVDAKQIDEHVNRCLFLENATTALSCRAAPNDVALSKALESMKDTSAKMSTSISADTTFVKALIEDVNGQTAEALSKMEWFVKWGKHFVPSIVFAHRVQQCNNFKDPGVQEYGGELFREIRDNADDLFNTLPAPKPSARNCGQSGSTTSSGWFSSPAPVRMAAYNDRYSG